MVAEGIIDILVQSEPPSIASSSRDTTHLSADIASDIIYQLFAHPQEDSTERVERKTHEDGDLVALALQDFGGDRGEEEVTTTEVHDLKTSGFELGNTEDILEVLVEHVKKTVGETPEEEQ